LHKTLVVCKALKSWAVVSVLIMLAPILNLAPSDRVKGLSIALDKKIA
jgi:hypothetical protein